MPNKTITHPITFKIRKFLVPLLLKVEVIKLVARGTIEEKILELQKKKQLLSDKLIESDNPDAEIFNKLTEEDIRDLLAFENKQ